MSEIIGDRYEVERELGTGGFATTYAAIDRQTGKRVAVKVLDLRRVGDWKAVELFEREAKVLRTLDHEGIPAYVEFRPLEEARQAFLVQELAPGANLQRLLAERRFSEEDLRDLTRQLLEIFDYLTRQHPVVIHRDVKPANILLADDGHVSLVDFGAVRDIASVTIGGGSTVAGTFGYMAPEQLQGVAAPSSDLYGLGMTLVHLATGRDPSELEKKRLKPDFRGHVHFSDAFERFIDRLVEPVPDDRFQTAKEALAALQRLEREASDDDEALSPSHIAAQREVAERKRAKRGASAARGLEKTERAAPRARRRERVAIENDEHGSTALIRPTPGWRDREAHLAGMVVLAAISVPAGGQWLGASGALVGAVGVAALTFLVWLTAPTWRLRATTQGDFVFYKWSPRRPYWIGRLAELDVDGTRTASGDYMVRLCFERDGTKQFKQFYPLSSGDAMRIKMVASR